MLSSPLYHIDSGFPPPCVDQEPAGPQVYLMSMSLTTEPSNDGPTVTEGLIYYFLTYISLYHLSLCDKVCVKESRSE